jgi:hypothetical protein
MLDRREIVGLVTTAARDRVTAVRLRQLAADGAEEILDADLVVDATGRGSRTHTWLATIGYDQPPEEQLTIQLKYATRQLELRPGALGGQRWSPSVPSRAGPPASCCSHRNRTGGS